MCKSCIGLIEAENGREWPRNTGSQSEPLICDFSGIVTEGFTIPETVFSKYIL